MRPSLTLFAGLFAANVAASSAFAVDLSESVDVAASPADAWATIADWCSITDWRMSSSERFGE